MTSHRTAQHNRKVCLEPGSLETQVWQGQASSKGPQEVPTASSSFWDSGVPGLWLHLSL